MLVNIKGIILIALVVIFSGCSGSANVMNKAPNQNVNDPGNNYAQIVFMRDSIVAGAITAELFEISKGKIRFIGALPNGKKIVYKTSPGRKIYMAFGNAADFMMATVSAGKTYYSIVRPNWATGGFAPTPIRRDKAAEFNISSDEFKEWLEGTELITTDKTKARVWFKDHREKIVKIYKDYWARFKEKSKKEKAARTLFPNDGTSN